MIRLVDFLIGSLAVWRLSSLLARESGPNLIFERIRGYISDKFVDSKYYGYASFYDGLTCMWCNSLWISPLVSLAIANNIKEYIICVLAFSALSVIIEEAYQFIKGEE